MLSRPDFSLDGGVRTADAACSVSELNRRARTLLEGGIGRVRVRGEISGFTRAASGHMYFSLKDEGAQVRCALWRSKAGALAFEPKNGDAVEVQAAVTLFEARGEYQLSIESMRRAGAGALYEQLLRLKEKLAGEGLFDAGRKRVPPAMPRAIGIVTSLQAAALRDVLATLARRAPMIPVIVFPAPVQGEGAAAQLARAIEAAGGAAEHGVGIDLLIVCRGGGSMEDLWTFNEEVVARAIAACPVPVVAGIGHETDFTIADWVADVRAPTPTAAAELASPDIGDLRARLAVVTDVLSQAATRRIADAQQRLDWLVRTLLPPSARLRLQRQGLAHLCVRLRAAAAVTLDARQARHAQARARLRRPAFDARQIQLAHARRRLVGAVRAEVTARDAVLERLLATLHMLDPRRVLERGFAIVSDGAGRVVRDGAALAAGDRLGIRLARGAAEAVVVAKAGD